MNSRVLSMDEIEFNALVEREIDGREIVTTKSGVEYLRSSIVTPDVRLIREVDWLWEPYLARGLFTTSEGASDLGKTTTWLDIAARLSSGQILPDGRRLEPMGVVIISYEDDIDMALTPRLAAVGADLSKIRVLQYVLKPGDKYPTP